MKYTTKRDFLLKELLSIIDQSLICAEKTRQLAETENNPFFTNKCANLKKVLKKMRFKITHHAEQPLNKADLVSFKKELEPIFTRSYRTLDEMSQFYSGNVLFADQPLLQQIGTLLIYAMRAVLSCVDWFFSSAVPEFQRNAKSHPGSDSHSHAKSYDQHGETFLALRLTGHSQFFPRPIHCLHDARKALTNITDRLELVYIGIEYESR